MQTIAQNKAKINGWIKQYQKRIEEYKKKYGEYSFKYELYKKSCVYKIKSWEKELSLFEKKKDYTKAIQFILDKTNKYFVTKVKWDKSRSVNIDTNPEKYYICRFLVEAGLNGITCEKVLKTTVRNIYQKREVCSKTTKHKNTYRAYRLTIEAALKAENIIYK